LLSPPRRRAGQLEEVGVGLSSVGLREEAVPDDGTVAAREPVLICLLGGFRLLKAGVEVPVRYGGKTETLLSSLALRERYRAPREWLLATLWPDGDAARSLHALNSLVHALRQLLGDALAGEPPVVHVAGSYALNVVAGVSVDIARFDTLASAAKEWFSMGDTAAAMHSCLEAVALYGGDVCAVDDVRAVVERERLRALYLSLLGRVADHAFQERDYQSTLRYALRLLLHDPCREDAHRLVMRCYVRLGERAQALRQYRTCQQILASEFGACPEPLTDALFQQVRLDPGSV
jgi:DNA-binding SARP family transcriptional activator